ncbi:iron-hydroxamate ABC transporter substrate-binding protein [Sporosarcina sp. JAI121]|uniref:iron-hydroxamate ABC transporter substrate-binding protein n=1 Tax=Sporosarcina sp. JAI121 TaxID=2723064 RepID=UPI0015CA9EB9|nr:iron-hydroxamate ABC transporter substrate-binding protein [Sporosarcina sp. JAI121]NYF24036.1 iron complex transport system substrate-binding protein [Sporosarcina sp. JAI121]
MKKKLLFSLILVLLMVVSACGNNSGAPVQDTDRSIATNDESETITYPSENGPVEVPSNPKRIVALTNAPNVLALDGTLVGVDQWTNANPLFTDKLEGIEVVSEDELEKIIELEPDLIIAGTEMKNLDKLGQIAPTVAFTWGKLDYLAQQLEIGKLLNKVTETQAWIDDFKQRAEATGKEIKAKYGENITVSVFETDSKSFYVFGNNWARGTEILYQAMGLNMPEKVKQDALGPGFYILSQEVIPEYAGDFVVLSRTAGDNSYTETKTWSEIPAVKSKNIIEIDTKASTYSDPITIEYLFDIYKEGFLGKM